MYNQLLYTLLEAISVSGAQELCLAAIKEEREDLLSLINQLVVLSITHPDRICREITGIQKTIIVYH